MRKKYGDYQVPHCPFCQKQAITKNSQGLPVCTKHKDEELQLKCVCGQFLEARSGKFGAFFSCPRCGNVNMAKALAMNEQTNYSQKK